MISSEKSLIRAGALSGPLAAVAPSGGKRKLLLEAAGIESSEISNPDAVIELDRYCELLLRCEHFVGDRQFLIRAGLNASIQELGLTGQAILASDTLGRALSIARDSLRYFQDDSHITQTINRGRCRLHYFQAIDQWQSSSQDIQYTIGILANIIYAANHNTDPDVTVGYPGAGSSIYYVLPIGVRVVSSKSGFIEFNERALASPMPNRDPIRTEILTTFLEQNSIELACTQSMQDLVSQLTRISMGIEKPTPETIAGFLGIGVRSLQRMLKTEGASFRRILEDVRRSAAVAELGKGESVTQTALKLGYDHPQNFTTAFQKWYGQAPSSV